MDKIKKSLLRSTILGGVSVVAGVASMGIGTAIAETLPQGAAVQHGTVAITQNGAAMTVRQHTDSAILNWQSFSVSKNASVHFAQPSESASILNRVVGNESSTIAGTITATGQVFLVNPNGILFTESATVDTASFTASTLDINNADFLNGTYTFSRTADHALVENRGTITAQDAGFIGFISSNIANTGTVRAHLGHVAFGSGDKVALTLGGDSSVRILVDVKDLKSIKDTKGNHVYGINANGAISANGGVVELRAGRVKSLVDSTINMGGTVSATTVGNARGKIVLAGGNISAGGTADVSSNTGAAGRIEIATSKNGAFSNMATLRATGVTGGRITVRTGSSQEMARASYDVSGTERGGKISHVAVTTKTDKNGKIQRGGLVMTSATYTANSANGAAGAIDISSAGNVSLFSAKVHADGVAGGLIRIGGIFQGGDQRLYSRLSDDLKRGYVERWGTQDDLVASKVTRITTTTEITANAVAATGTKSIPLPLGGVPVRAGRGIKRGRHSSCFFLNPPARMWGN